MISPTGYVPLSKLWADFVAKRRAELFMAACRFYQDVSFLNDPTYANRPEFGSPLDFVEDIFLESLKAYRVSLCQGQDVVKVKRKLNSGDVIDALSDLFIMRGVPDYIRSDNGPEFVAQAVLDWIRAVGAKTAYIAPGSTWENGYFESFNAKFRDELLNGEVFYSLREAGVNPPVCGIIYPSCWTTFRGLLQ